ncbi:hypothetical protein F4808DRAFT_462802 [Astrocystis sublimbata]|nr:hypothetical protein F4808DRAFT_462802 [Astrocystis sublimbata]
MAADERAAETDRPLQLASWPTGCLLQLGGHYNNSEFVEIDGKKKVSDEVLRITGASTRLEDLQVVTDLRTKRLAWEVARLADGKKPSAKITIVMDEVTEASATATNDTPTESAFTHIIGERKKIAALRMGELKDFMMANSKLFATTPTPVGKLTAYEMWKGSRA